MKGREYMKLRDLLRTPHLKEPPRRHPLLVVIWGVVIFISMELTLLPGFFLIEGDKPSDIGTWDPETILIFGLWAFLGGIPLSLMILRLLWRRQLVWMGFRPGMRGFSIGFGSGLLLSGLVIGILTVFGVAQTDSQWDQYENLEIIYFLLGFFGIMLFVGLVEEAFFRGILFREWSRSWNPVIAAVIGSLIFGGFHVSNMDNPTTNDMISIILSIFIIGILLSVLYHFTGNLWTVIGLHAAWNFSLIAIFGVTLSGLEPGPALFTTSFEGSTYLTGGDFGVEASVVTYGILGLATILIFFIYRKRIHRT